MPEVSVRLTYVITEVIGIIARLKNALATDQPAIPLYGR